MRETIFEDPATRITFVDEDGRFSIIAKDLHNDNCHTITLPEPSIGPVTDALMRRLAR